VLGSVHGYQRSKGAGGVVIRRFDAPVVRCAGVRRAADRQHGSGLGVKPGVSSRVRFIGHDRRTEGRIVSILSPDLSIFVDSLIGEG
jgi:hypothetical protein